MSEDLLKYRRDVYTSTGNDGIIERIFQVLKLSQGIFVEFGASDGISGCNCKKLYDEGWEGLFIEPKPERYQKLVQNYPAGDISLSNTSIGTTPGNTFDEIVGQFLNGAHIDFCSIDIDGLDLEIFETFKQNLPTVVCIEGGQMLPPNHPRIPIKQAKHNIQQSLGVMVESFISRGYRVLCSYQDTFFIKQEFFALFNVPVEIHELYFNGLRAIPHRIPFIHRFVTKVGLKNPIVKRVLKQTQFQKYLWPKRKLWVKEKHNEIQQSINQEQLAWSSSLGQ